MLEFYQKNDCVYVGELTINQCWGKIRGWINMSSLMGYLMRNGLVNNADDMDAISSPYLTATVRQTNLMQLLSANGGGNGHFLFYMSLCESLESNPLGHGDAVDELKRRGEFNNSLIKGVVDHDCNAPPLLVYYLGGLTYQARPFSLLCIPKNKAQEYTCIQVIIYYMTYFDCSSYGTPGNTSLAKG